MGNPGPVVVLPFVAVWGTVMEVYRIVVLLLEYHISGQTVAEERKAVDSAEAYQSSPNLAVQTLGEVVKHA